MLTTLSETRCQKRFVENSTSCAEMEEIAFRSDLRWDVHRPQACIGESIRLDTPHGSAHKWGNKIK